MVSVTAAMAAGQVVDVERRGEHGPALLLIPEAGVRADSWSAFLDRNASRYRMAAVTLRGGAGVEALSRWLDEQKLNRVVIAGQGAGGTLGVALAAKRPDVIAGAVSINGAITSSPGRPSFALDYLAPDRVDLYRSAAAVAPPPDMDQLLRAVTVPVLSLRHVPRGPNVDGAAIRAEWAAELKRAGAPLTVQTAFVDGGEYFLEEFLPEVVDDALERFVRGQEVKDYHKRFPPPQPGAAPCSSDPAFRDFDFWVGDWDVKPAQGPTPPQPMFNRITREERGCLIHEAWNGGGLTGQSFNIFEASRRIWRQFWVDAGGTVHEYWGRWRDGAMRMRGFIRSPRFAAPLPVRLTFFRLGPDTVRQFSETSADGGTTWSTAYDFIYERRK